MFFNELYLLTSNIFSTLQNNNNNTLGLGFDALTEQSPVKFNLLSKISFLKNIHNS